MAVMIFLGEDWCAEIHRVFHACGPDLHTAFREANRETCHCGATVPRRVHQFLEWLSDSSREAPGPVIGV
jgi:hypothetical protein